MISLYDGYFIIVSFFLLGLYNCVLDKFFIPTIIGISIRKDKSKRSKVMTIEERADIKGITTGQVLCDCPDCVRNAVLSLGETVEI